DLGDGIDRADVNPHLQGRGADGGDRRAVVLESRLDVFADLFGEVAVVGYELDRYVSILTPSHQDVGVGLYRAAGVREDEVVAAPERSEQVVGDRRLIPRIGLVGIIVEVFG